MGNESPARRSGVRVLGYTFLGLFLLLCTVALVGYFALNSKPGYWDHEQQRIAAMSEADREALSADLLGRFSYFWYDTPSNPARQEDLLGHRSTIEVTYEELNVLIAHHGLSVLSELGLDLPSEVHTAMVDSPGDGLLRVSCEVDSGQGRQVVGLTFAIDVGDDGMVVGTLENATAGRMSLPAATAVDLLAGRGGDRAAGLLRGEPVGPIDLPIDREGGVRDGRLVGLEIQDDALVITRVSVLKPRADE